MRHFINFRYFEKQLDFVSETKLPVFFHCRAAHPDFCAIVSRHRDSIPGGVVIPFPPAILAHSNAISQSAAVVFCAQPHCLTIVYTKIFTAWRFT